MAKRSRHLAAVDQQTDDSDQFALADVRRVLEPYLAGCLKTLGLLGAGSDDKAGDVRAAALALEFWLKTMAGKEGQAERVLREIRALRENATIVTD